jgi:uncharacterized protein
MITQEIIEQIKDYAIRVDWYIAFNGKAKGNKHLFRVAVIAQFLAEKEGAQKEICEAGAWLHDLSLVDGNDDDPTKVRASAEKFLARLPMDAESRRRIAECAETHEGAGDAVSIEAKIVHDADALDKMGLLGAIRHTWKIVNLIEPDASAKRVYALLQSHLRARQERLYTETARKLVRKLNESLQQFFADEGKAIKMLERIMQLAKAGTTSDDIAKGLLLKSDIPALIRQLCVTNELLEDLYADVEEARVSVEINRQEAKKGGGIHTI